MAETALIGGIRPGRFQSYEDWKRWALKEDERTGADRWKDEETSNLYDYQVIRRRYEELVDVRSREDPGQLLYYLNEGLHGNMAGMGAPALYAKARFGTKALISDYVDELVKALDDLAGLDDSQISPAEKLAYFRRAQDCFGRSALMLSGAGSLGPFHVGVTKALIEQELLPDVISGASAGSVVTAILGTHTNEELREKFASQRVLINLQQLDAAPGFLRPKPRITLDEVKALIENSIPDMTFIEAFELTGRAINISVAPSSLHQRSRMLNASTSPNACIRESVLASCAIPGVFPAVTLYAKNAAGERQPYVPSRQWVDGSITDDLPARRLARLYGINHFISSQANPVVLWALRDPHDQPGLVSRAVAIQQSATREWLRALYPFAIDMVRNFYPLNTYTRFLFSLMTQEYTADITIMPKRRLFDPDMLLASLSAEETEALVQEGERSTWPKIEMIRTCTAVSRAIATHTRNLTGLYASA